MAPLVVMEGACVVVVDTARRDGSRAFAMGGDETGATEAGGDDPETPTARGKNTKDGAGRTLLSLSTVQRFAEMVDATIGEKQTRRVPVLAVAAPAEAGVDGAFMVLN